jgi:hypothetical protein
MHRYCAYRTGDAQNNSPEFEGIKILGKGEVDMSRSELIKYEDIRSRIDTIRGLQVMIDRDLASLYDVETRVLNQAVKRNSERFPDEYCFQLNDEEFSNWKSQIKASVCFH